MDQKDVFRQMMKFNKQTFENTFNALVVFQDQSEALFNGMLDRATWMPEEGRKAVGDWVKAYKKNREDFRKSVNDGFGKLEDFMTRTFPTEKAS
jgi:hypothetical protein